MLVVGLPLNLNCPYLKLQQSVHWCAHLIAHRKFGFRWYQMDT